MAVIPARAGSTAARFARRDRPLGSHRTAPDADALARRNMGLVSRRSPGPGAV